MYTFLKFSLNDSREFIYLNGICIIYLMRWQALVYA